MRPDMGEMPDGMAPPAGFNDSKMDFERNEDGTITLPGGTVTDPPGLDGCGDRGPREEFGGNTPNKAVELSEIFTIKTGANYFGAISIKE